MPFQTSAIKTVLKLGSAGAITSLILAMTHAKFPFLFAFAPSPYLFVAILIVLLLGMPGFFAFCPFFAMTLFLMKYRAVDHTEIESLLTFTELFEPISLLTLSIIVAVGVDQKKREIKLGQLETNKLNQLTESLKNANDALQSEKSDIEREVVNRVKTAASFFERAEVLESFDLGEISESLVGLIAEQVGADSCYLYLLRKNTLLCVNHKDIAEKRLPSIIGLDEITKYPTLQKCIEEKKVTKSEDLDQDTDSDTAFSLAGPLLDQSNKILGVVVIREIDFLNYLPSTFTGFEAVLKWAGLVISRVLRAKIVSDAAQVNPTTGLLTYDYYKRRIAAEYSQSQRFSLSLCLIQFRLDGIEKLSPPKRIALTQVYARRLVKDRRETDEIISGKEAGTFFTIARLISDSEITQYIERAKKSLAEELANLGGLPLKFEYKKWEFSPKDKSLPKYLLDEGIQA